MSYLKQAQQAIEGLHLCDARHIATVRVCEHNAGRKIWDGDVEVFQLQGFASADRSYVWGYSNEQRNGALDFISVPATPPITTPAAAVLAVLAWEEKVRQ